VDDRQNPDHSPCLGLSSSLVKANNTAKGSDFSHSCTFFCYLLAFRSSVPPSFFSKRHHLQLKTTTHPQALSSPTTFYQDQQHASQRFSKSSFPSSSSSSSSSSVQSLPSTTPSPELAARVDASPRIGHTISLWIGTSLTLLSVIRRCLLCTSVCWTCMSLTSLCIQLLSDCLGSTRARATGTRYLFGSARA
jgi:hypothetical protein